MILSNKLNYDLYTAVLRIHLIFDADPSHDPESALGLIFNRRIFLLFSFLCNNSKNHSEIKTVQIEFWEQKMFFLQFLVDILPCIRIQEGKTLRIQRIQNLSTDFNKLPFLACWLSVLSLYQWEPEY